ncbi:MAG: tRNA pseudouridine55 synthase [Bacteroidetes bacterium]|nr:MAG: tRNA pseudouridine55 synthase [Bacteroidota bacterium]
MPEEKHFDFAAGEVLAIHKPLNWTSFDVVNRLRSMIKHKLKLKLKVGHAGTLDPLAEGLLIICTGKFTKRIDEYQGQEKEYTGMFCIGATTPCFDLEKPVDMHYPVDHITDEMIHAAAQTFTGKIRQIPPHFSAIKVEGKRAYDLARAGTDAQLQPREVEITTFEITRIERKGQLIEADFRVVCGKGTYIRALAHDLGSALGSGAYLGKLSRTRIGDIRLDQALSVDQVKAIIETLAPR